MSTGAAGKTKVAEVADLPDGQGRVVDVAGRTLAVFNVGGRSTRSTTRVRIAAGRSARVTPRARSSSVPGMAGAGTSRRAPTPTTRPCGSPATRSAWSRARSSLRWP